MEVLQHSSLHAFPLGDGPLLSLGDAFASRFHSWHGASGQRYVMSVFAADPSCPDRGLLDFDTCIVVPVQREGRARRAWGALILERGSDRRRLLAHIADVAVDEWHLHLLAADRHERADVAADLNARFRDDRVARLA